MHHVGDVMKAIVPCLALLLIACEQATQPEQPQQSTVSAQSADDWAQVTTFTYAQSEWLSFVSIAVFSPTQPTQIKVVIKNHNDTTLVSSNITLLTGNWYYTKFQNVNTAGYPFNLDLSVSVLP